MAALRSWEMKETKRETISAFLNTITSRRRTQCTLHDVERAVTPSPMLYGFEDEKRKVGKHASILQRDARCLLTARKPTVCTRSCVLDVLKSTEAR